MVLPFFGRILRLASIVICVIAALYFGAFALDQTSSASSHQQAELNGTEQPAAGATAKSEQKSGLHEAIDEAFGKLASPFSGVTSSTTGAWSIHIVDTLLVLIVYGFGLAFVARLLKLAQ
ncbi:MAG TPA: hypothetical protein VGY30_00650 [Solirubrobacteraceae bacterium]|jgi:hypothetical protein|nr:hypothetical protein [Solirubrobacteraceae bacterium]